MVTGGSGANGLMLLKMLEDFLFALYTVPIM